MGVEPTVVTLWECRISRFTLSLYKGNYDLLESNQLFCFQDKFTIQEKLAVSSHKWSWRESNSPTNLAKVHRQPWNMQPQFGTTGRKRDRIYKIRREKPTVSLFFPKSEMLPYRLVIPPFSLFICQSEGIEPSSYIRHVDLKGFRRLCRRSDFWIPSRSYVRDCFLSDTPCHFWSHGSNAGSDVLSPYIEQCLSSLASSRQLQAHRSLVAWTSK